ncbi:myo-inositol-1-phosphate synthase [Leishmania mexicana MHOM/GT/2001/U1103]|uniref:Inositol-3-phosphate synthase n=3 Tax=Leishmania mexicana TaxID=5665 RepID=E9APY4_LEIMU|nr:myo-inositol-1-phosphate synthase [Leishmania mexicana MHOM/GT/2001/U1103]CAC69872.1 myo-inositol-1-phosphate synthase [Leishmania mexicana mexicana]CBZ25002.1 myo-inositol-1-phosphate synthase [Leishmania mexicana MHOM/GT/2001/U1103]
MPAVHVKSDKVHYTSEAIESLYDYATTRVRRNSDGTVSVEPVSHRLLFRTERHVPRVGVMLVGWGGNNGTTVTAGILANKLGLKWRTRHGMQSANYFGSITQASTINLGMTRDMDEVFVPLKDVVPMVSPDDLVIGGWDCNNMNLGDAMRRAAVLDVQVQDALYCHMSKLCPLPAIFDIDFVAANQKDRANNVIDTQDRWDAVGRVRKDIRDFKEANKLDKVIVLWTANTERFSEHRDGVHDTAENLLAAVKRNESELAPSTLYAMAAVLEKCSFINGAPQNTLCPGLVEMAREAKVFVGGDDFKSGQTKMKSALVEFFVGAGIKPECIASYNHLGNNDGYNLSSHKQFCSKEITKSNVVDDMIKSNSVLFPEGARKPDHCIVIKYIPYVGDSKRALDEYTFSIFMGGQQTVVLHNTCEDSLLAAPLIIDLIVLTELMERVTICASDELKAPSPVSFEHMETVLSILSYLLKAPAVPEGTPVVNALNRQRAAIENLLRAMIGLPADSNMLLECRVPFMREEHVNGK